MCVHMCICVCAYVYMYIIRVSAYGCVRERRISYQCVECVHMQRMKLGCAKNQTKLKICTAQLNGEEGGVGVGPA